MKEIPSAAINSPYYSQRPYISNRKSLFHSHNITHQQQQQPPRKHTINYTTNKLLFQLLIFLNLISLPATISCLTLALSASSYGSHSILTFGGRFLYTPEVEEPPKKVVEKQRASQSLDDNQYKSQHGTAFETSTQNNGNQPLSDSENRTSSSILEISEEEVHDDTKSMKDVVVSQSAILASSHSADLGEKEASAKIPSSVENNPDSQNAHHDPAQPPQACCILASSASTESLESASSTAFSAASQDSERGDSSGDLFVDDLGKELPVSERRYPSSRFLLRILVVGLFALLLGTLIIVYSIKFCVCQRRKRELSLLSRRDLVADLVTNANNHSSSFLTALPFTAVATQCPEPPIRIQSLTAPSSIWSSFCSSQQTASAANHHHHHHLPPLDYSIYQRLAIAERLALQHLANHPGANQASCLQQAQSAAANTEFVGLSGPPTCTCYPSSFDSNFEIARCAPPAYSELFGQVNGAESSSVPPSHLLNSSGASSNNSSSTYQQNNQDTSSSPTPSGSSQIQAAQSSSSHSISLNNYHQNQKNLLVKLNLNKTKLLSAEDLVLLSKLIDVPIVVQQQQPLEEQDEEQELQQQQQQQTGSCDEISAGTTTTLEDLNEEAC